jgi:flagellin-like protein
MKGISTIIASILLLVITIGLAGTAYIFISSLLTTSISKTINVLDMSCTPSGNPNKGNITVILSNDGTVNIKDSELIVMVDGNVKSDKFPFNPDPVTPHSTAVATSSDDYGSGVHTVVVTSPSNSIRGQSVFC